MVPKHRDWAAGTPPPQAAPSGWLAVELHGLPDGERPEALARRLREQVASALEIEDPRGLDPNRPLFEVGLTSLRAIEIRDALSASLAITLPATLLFDHPTVAALTLSLGQQVLGLEAPEPPAPAGAARRLMEEIDQLSDEEATALLAGAGSS